MEKDFTSYTSNRASVPSFYMKNLKKKKQTDIKKITQLKKKKGL